MQPISEAVPHLIEVRSVKHCRLDLLMLSSSRFDPNQTSAAFSLALVAGRRDPKFYDFGPPAKVGGKCVVSAFCRL